MTRIAPARVLLALAAVLAVLLPSAPAWAHNALAEATPAKNARLTKAPTGVKLRFLQKLDPAAITITVEGAEVSEPKVDGATVTVAFTAPPANGEHTVAYEVSSRDGHKVKGSYKFTVAAPAPATTATTPPTTSPAAPPPAAVTATPVPLAAEDDGGNGGLIAGIVVAALAVAALAGFLIVRRRRQAG